MRVIEYTDRQDLYFYQQGDDDGTTFTILKMYCCDCDATFVYDGPKGGYGSFSDTGWFTRAFTILACPKCRGKYDKEV